MSLGLKPLPFERAAARRDGQDRRGFALTAELQILVGSEVEKWRAQRAPSPRAQPGWQIRPGQFAVIPRAASALGSTGRRFPRRANTSVCPAACTVCFKSFSRAVTPGELLPQKCRGQLSYLDVGHRGWTSRSSCQE